MTYRNVLQWPNSKLFKKAKTVDDFGEKLQSLIKDMVDTCNIDYGAGLAANQIGVLQRVVVLKPKSMGYEEFEPCNYNKDFIAMINPKIEISGDEIAWIEQCLSLKGVQGKVKRGSNVLVKYQNEFGEQKTLEASWSLSGAIQHECDHLDGVTFNKRMSRPSGSLMLSKLRKIQKKKERQQKKAKKHI